MRKEEYHEHKRKRDRATERKAMREKMKEKQAPFKPKTKQVGMDGKELEEE